jgi:hypothetical protein
MKFAMTYDDIHDLGVTASHAGKGSGSVLLHPETIVRCLKQLERWTRLALLNRKTKLNCPEHGLQRVTNCYNHTATLACECKRSVHTMTDSDYQDLVSRAQGLKVTGRNARVGGYELVLVEDLV